MLATSFHIAFGIAGALLLYMGLFLTDTEEGNLENRLEGLWIRVDDIHSKAMSRQAVLLRQVATLVAEGFKGVFGRKLFSVKAIASCLCFCLASLFLSLALFVGETPFSSKRVRLACSLIFLVCGFTKYLRYLGFVSVAFGIVVEWIGLTGDLHAYQGSPKQVLLTFLTYVVGILIAVCFISLIRWSMNLASHLSNGASLIVVLAANVALGAALVWPLVYVQLRYRLSIFTPRGAANPAPQTHALLIFAYSVSATNVFTAVAAFGVLVTLVVALLHHLMWPAISRPIYAAHRYGLVRQHKVLVALGAACLGLAWPNNIVVKAIEKGVHLGN